MFVIQADTEEEYSRTGYRDSRNPEEDFTELLVVDREHKNNGSKHGNE